LYDITSYDSTAFLTVVPTSAPADGTMVRVNAFDGIMASGAATITQAAPITQTAPVNQAAPTTQKSSATALSCGGLNIPTVLLIIWLWRSFKI